MSYFYPNRLFCQNSIRQGMIPFWNPYNFFGTPFSAQPDKGILYPLSAIVYLLPFNIGIDLYITLHFFLASLFMYWLMRGWVDRQSSLFSAITYGFSGFMLSGINISYAPGASWTPLFLLALLRAEKLKSLRYGVGAGICLGMQFLCGTPAFLYFNLLILFILGVYWTVRNFLFIKILSVVLLSFLGLFLFQILPFLQMLSLSFRAESLPYSHTIDASLSPAELIELLLPGFTNIDVEGYSFCYIGQWWILSIYLGILPILFATIALFIKSRLTLTLGFGTLLLLLFSFGGYTPFHYLAYRLVPGIDLVRYPVKSFSHITLFLSILAGIGFSFVKERVDEKRWAKLFFLFFLLYLILVVLLYKRFDVEWLKSVELLLLPTSIEEISLWHSSNISSSLLTASFLLFASLTLSFRKSSLFSLLILLNIVDLHIAGDRLNYMVEENFYRKPEIADILKDGRFARLPSTVRALVNISTFKSDREKMELSWMHIPGNVSSIYKIFYWFGMESLPLREPLRLISVSGILQEREEEVLPVLSMMNVRYFVSLFDLKKEGLVLIHSGTIKVYENPNSLERVFFVSDYRVIEDKEEVLRYILSPEFDPEREVVLEEEPEKVQNAKCKMQSAKCEILEYSPNKVVIKAFCPSDGFLFLSDTYYPEWRCYVDGKLTKIYRANYCFRAVILNKGEHTVEFFYFPRTFYIGLMASVISVIIVIGLLLKR
jgi:hypothetical protein